MKLPLYYINQKYVNNLENIMNLLNHVCFLHPMNMLGFKVICVSLIECIRGWMNCCHRSFTRKKKESKEGDKNGRQKKIDLVYGKYTNVCKLGAKWNGQGFNNHKSQSQQSFVLIIKIWVNPHYGDPLWDVTLYCFPRVCMFECIPPQTFKRILQYFCILC